MLLLKQDTIKKKQVNKLFAELELELKVDKNKKYKVEVIQNSEIYINKDAKSQLLKLYYLLS